MNLYCDGIVKKVQGREPNELGLAPAKDDQRYLLVCIIRWIEIVVLSGLTDRGYLERHWRCSALIRA